MSLAEHLIDLSNTPGLSGFEGPVRDLLLDRWGPLVDETSVDALGNLLVVKQGTGKKPRCRVLVTAHMDEIGLMVSALDGAFLRVTSIGGIDKRVLPGQPVMVHGERDLPGLIATRPPHVLSAEERKNYPLLKDLFIDTGLTARQLAKLVQIGNPVSISTEATKMSSDLVTGKALDNRAGVASMTRLLEELQTRLHVWDVCVAATTQEENGFQGATVLSYATRPDIAIVVDVTYGVGTGVGDDAGFKLGNGLSLIIGPNAHPKLYELMRETAKKLEIKIHPEPASRSSGTEGMGIQISREGVPTAVIGIPLRNMHTPVEIVNLKDIERTARLIAEFITTLDDDTLDKLVLD